MDSKLKVQGRVSKVSNHQLRPKNERASMRKNKNQGASDWTPGIGGARRSRQVKTEATPRSGEN